jgi:hypothetical protein
MEGIFQMTTRLASMAYAAAIALTTLAVPSADALALPTQPTTLETPASEIQQVRFRGGFHRGFHGHRFHGHRFYRHGFYRHGFYGHRVHGRRYWHRGYFWGPGVVAGSILAGALLEPWYGYPYGWYGYPYW